MFVDALWVLRDWIPSEALSTKARVASLDPTERQRLFDHVLARELQDTEQGKVIGRYLHLSLFRINSAGQLTPSVPLPRYERCSAWIGPGFGCALSNLKNLPGPFAEACALFKADPRCHQREDEEFDVVQEIVISPVVEVGSNDVKLSQLPVVTNKLLFAIEYLRIDTLTQRAEPSPLGSQQSNGDADMEVEGEDNENGGGLEEEEEEENEQGIKDVDSDDEDGKMEDEVEKPRGEDESSEGEDVLGAKPTHPKPKPKPPKKKAGPDAAYRPPPAPRRRAPPAQAPPPSPDARPPSQRPSRDHSPRPLAPSSSLVIGEYSPFLDVNDQANNLASWRSSRFLSDPNKFAEDIIASLTATSPLVHELLRRFRLSNRYAPFGTSVDSDHLDIDEFVQALKSFVDAESQNEEEDEQPDDGDLESSPQGVKLVRLGARAFDVVLEILEHGAEDSGYRFLRRISSELANSN